MKIFLDFDGVIHSFSKGFQSDGSLEAPTEGALDFVRWCVDNGHEVVIFTSRAAEWGKDRDCVKSVLKVRGWLIENGFPDRLRITGSKEPAELYVDDRGYRFNGSFDELKKFIDSGAIPYHKKGVF